MSHPVKLSNGLVLGTALPISGCLESADTPAGRQRVATVLAASPFPHYEQHPDSPGLLVRIEEDGRRTTGRFVNRAFKPESERCTQGFD